MKINTKKIIEKFKMLTDTRVLSLLAFGFVAILVTWSGIKVVQLNYELDKKISVQRQKNDVEKLKNENLKLKNTYYQTNQYLELASRRQFGKAAQGEKLYIVPEQSALARTKAPEKSDTASSQTAKKESTVQKNLKDWQHFLFR